MKTAWLSQVALSLCFLSSSANATLISRDWLTAGDTGLTLDTATGLEWLDLTYTANRSYDTVLGQLATGGAFTGFRYATVGQVQSLFAHAGIPDVGSASYSSADYAPVKSLFGQVGQLRGLPGGGWSHAITGSSVGGGQIYSNLQFILSSPPFIARAQPDAGTIAPDAAFSDTGSWLVRAVPEPSTLLLLALGVALMLAGTTQRDRMRRCLPADRRMTAPTM